jgi:single-strand DNA-binding protein
MGLPFGSARAVARPYFAGSSIRAPPKETEMPNANSVLITGNLTRDPDLRYSQGSGEFVCKLRLAVNGLRKDAESGRWVDRPNYFDVAVWGEHAHTCANYLLKGRGIAVAGRLRWHEWVAAGARREGVEIVATRVKFLSC